MVLPLDINILLMCCAIVASTVDTVAGGGGLLTVPALLLSGLSPALALGTNKLQASCGSTTAALHFIFKGKMAFKDYWRGLVASLIGGCIGPLLLLKIDPLFLDKVIPFLLIFVLAYTLFSKRSGIEDKPQRVPFTLFWISAGLLIGFYDGFLGPGTGSFWVISIVAFLGFNFKKATMHAKIYNAASNIMALIIFLFKAKLALATGLFMAAGQIIGARIGAHFVLNKSAHFIKPIFISMVVIMLVLLGLRYWF